MRVMQPSLGGEFLQMGGQTIDGTKKSQSCGLHPFEQDGFANNVEKDQTSTRNGKYTRTFEEVLSRLDGLVSEYASRNFVWGQTKRGRTPQLT